MFQIWWKHHSVTLISFCVKLFDVQHIPGDISVQRAMNAFNIKQRNMSIQDSFLWSQLKQLHLIHDSLIFFCNYFKAGELKRPMVHMASQKRRGGRGGEEPSGKKKKPLGVHWEQLPRQKLGLINPSWVPWVRVYDIRKIVNTGWPQEK